MVLFVATAEAWDEDMAQRIARHQQERPAAWRTLETPRQVGQAIALHLHDTAVVLVDCLTLLVSTRSSTAARPLPRSSRSGRSGRSHSARADLPDDCGNLYCREQ